MRATQIFSALILTLHIFYTRAGIEDHYKHENFPKCCRKGSHYVLQNHTLVCADTYTNYIYNRDPQRKSKLQLKNETTQILNNATYNELAPTSDYCEMCAEVLKREKTAELIKVDCNGNLVSNLNHKFFPKCCPLGYFYNPKVHKCVKVESSEQFEGYLRVDLSSCKGVIVDYFDLKNFTIDASLAVILHFKGLQVVNYGDYCWEKDFLTRENVLRACEPSSVCKSKSNMDGITCVPKCCPDGHLMRGGCVPTHSHGINTSVLQLDKAFALFQARPGGKVLKPLVNPRLDSFGIIWEGETSSTNDKYCIEYHKTLGQKIFFYLDGEPAVETVKFNFRKVLVTISCIFLFLTIACYLLLPEMRENLYGKCVMIYCSIFLFGFAILTYMNFLGNRVQGTPCAVIGFLLIFAFLGMFSWLNIICFDMWMAFGQIRVRTLRSKKSDCKKLVYYNLYGWGIPILITLLIFGISGASWLPSYLNPSVGVKECFLEKEAGNYSHLLYFITPITLLIVSNFILFMKTILYCFQVKDEINKMKDTLPNEKAKRNKCLNADKEKLVMMIKLFVIMGISWLFEILASFVSFKENVILAYIELILDCINCLQGFFIFCILVLKRKVLTSLKNKVFRKLIRRSSDSSTTMTSVYSYIKNKDNVNRNTSETRR